MQRATTLPHLLSPRGQEAAFTGIGLTPRRSPWLTHHGSCICASASSRLEIGVAELARVPVSAGTSGILASSATPKVTVDEALVISCPGRCRPVGLQLPAPGCLPQALACH